MIYVSEDIWDFDLEAALKDISDQRREQALKFKHEQGQRLCVLAYQLLKEGLQKEYGLTDNPIFEYNEHGKPSNFFKFRSFRDNRNIWSCPYSL